MVFAAEIVLLLIGLYALISGRFFLTRSRVVHGYPGRVLGLLACAPLVMALALMFLFLRNPANESMQWNITVIEVGSIVACTGLIYFIGWPIAGPPWMQVAKEIGVLVHTYKTQAPVVTRQAADVPFMARVRKALTEENFQLSDPLFYRRKEIALIANRLHCGIEEFYLFIECDALDWDALIDLRKDTWDYAWAHRNPRGGLSQVLGGHMYAFAIAICKDVPPEFVEAVENQLPAKQEADDYALFLIYDATNKKLLYFQDVPAEFSNSLQPIQDLIRKRLEDANTELVNVEPETALTGGV